MGEETTIMGTILSVVFQNEENGYAVLRLVTDDGELLTLVGCVPCAAPGENLTATGSFSSHPQYGEQFSASEVERYLPSNETEILNYLASGVVRGVGPATAEKLVARFGIETLQVLESEPEKLTAIKGMTARRAQEISAAFNEQMGLRRVMEFLAHYDLPAALSVPLYRRFGANAMAALERNPYLLSDSAFGVDFSVCDEIALSMGFGGDASLRTEAGASLRALSQPRRGRTRLPPARKAPRRDGPAFGLRCRRGGKKPRRSHRHPPHRAGGRRECDGLLFASVVGG